MGLTDERGGISTVAMKARTILFGAIVGLAPVFSTAATIDRAVFTEVVNSVRVIEPATKKTGTAKVQAEFNAPSILRTGPDSRAEMISSDQTVTRVGQNTVFSFEPNSREVDLEKGSVLFQSPSGKGGGTIKTPSASAAVLGTTLIATTTKNGGFKVLLVEGKGRVTAADGSVRTLTSGQLVYALPGGKLSNVFEFRLSQQVGAAKLVSGFKKPLPSAAKIAAAIARQEKDIVSGKAIATNFLASSSPNYAYLVNVEHNANVKQNGETTVAATRFQSAATSDAIIFTPDLELERLFAPAELEVSGDAAPFSFSQGALGQTKDFARSTNGEVFVGNNIVFATPAVNLSPYEGHDVFQFLAVNDVLFDQSVNFGEFSGEVQFLAGGTMQAAPGVSISANAKRLSFLAVGSATGLGASLPASLSDFQTEVPLALGDFSAANEGGGLDLIGGDVRLKHTAFFANTNLRVLAARDFASQGAPGAVLNAPSTDFPGVAPSLDGRMSVFGGGGVAVTATRDFLASRTAFVSPNIRLSAGSKLALNVVQIDDRTAPLSSSSGQSSGPSPALGVRLFSQDLLSLNRVAFYANGVLMQSNTIFLQSVSFRDNSRIVLESRIGRLVLIPAGAPPQPGYVNIVRNTVKYGGVAVAPGSGAVIQNGPGPTPSGPGIVVRPRR